MWIASKLGFFSIVVKDGSYHVRARVKDDLATLLAAAKVPRRKIEEWPDADYRWRIRVPLAKQVVMDAIFGALMRSIDYPNFKSEIHRTESQRPKLPAYERLWSGLYQIQSGFGD